MSRAPRLHVPGGCYHVILRGNHQEPLFGSVADRTELNRIVEDVVGRFGLRIHAFCWMTNHLHALMQVAEQPLGGIVQRIAQRYSRYRHKQLGTAGHLFERRHKAKLVDIDAYFLALLRYIHLNPVKARLVDNPAEYRWSSHRAFLGKESVPWLTTGFALSLFSQNQRRARRAYRRFILENMEDDEDLELAANSKDPRVLGTDEFLSTIPAEIPPAREALTLDQLAETICRSYQITVEQLASPSRARVLSEPRTELAVRAVSQHIATLTEVARFINRAPSSLRELVDRRLERAGQ